ncbi:hypothetical protein HNP55_003801 [Paucibacter oligotrophus]|uniref:Uncharacterized protein n=1 Tax=Roseateles oligotrophus TaxID=1769250 RepID=A0A840L9J6_9BURK|nr:hypothetical protein [Roseateles oligotrophus]MBB4845254.1 hypothetical protein [Roseateles oligotrophus]
MIFLLEYDRHRGVLASIKSYADVEREAAEMARLNLELDLNRRALMHEVVLLEAADEQALRLTHGRYFESLQQIAAAGIRSNEKVMPNVR